MLLSTSAPPPFAACEHPLSRVALLDDALPPDIDYESALRGLAELVRLPSATAVSRLHEEVFDVVVVSLHSHDVAEVCREAAALDNPVDVIVITSHLDVAQATTAIRLGASDIVSAPEGGECLRLSAARLLEQRVMQSELQRLETTQTPVELVPQLLGEGSAMRRLRDTLGRAAGSSATVLITGESGTGKELVARALHRASPRSEQPFVAVSCGAIPPNLLEDELFGHKKGAFTNADRDRDGLLAHADGGTLFLDQMSDMPLDMQAKLLRALQERRFRPLGGAQERAFDARVVVATRRDLALEVGEGRFRKDLYFRLKVIEITLPPLREMKSDLLSLAYHFLRRSSPAGRPVTGLTLAAARALASYDWPGNVRELEHCITAAVAVARHERLCVLDLPEHVTRTRGRRDPFRVESLREVEEQHIQRVLHSVAGNKARAARILGVDRKTLQRKIGGYRLSRPPARRALDSNPGE
jgi:two-component system response regulator HydG